MICFEIDILVLSRIHNKPCIKGFLVLDFSLTLTESNRKTLRLGT